MSFDFSGTTPSKLAAVYQRDARISERLQHKPKKVLTVRQCVLREKQHDVGRLRQFKSKVACAAVIECIAHDFVNHATRATEEVRRSVIRSRVDDQYTTKIAA